MDVTCGEWSPVQPATTDIQLLCNEIRPIVQAKSSTVFAEFTAIEYSEQEVRGVHILIKVRVGNNFFIHILVYKNLLFLGGEVTVVRVKRGMKLDDPLEHFETE